ncbi:hypothetical protein BN77_4209 [Rhizobium mesoamericanum STM3625]|uniref:Uncharacterized protein n=1 Tax=Rhizobium mesoamericanum STM3625 TaxID=1211777 RepID=K0PTN2_9HYPH|nr:hypothetical protein BN77_4209 [Rhizobium mesoamericanum STM3625]
MIGRQKQTARPLDGYLSLTEDKPKDYQIMKRLLKTTTKTVASVLAVVALLSSTSYAGQTMRHHEHTATALKKDCRWVFLFWRSCTYSYVGANQVSKTHAKLPNSEIAVGFSTDSIFAGRTGRPVSKSSSTLWGNTSTDVWFSGGRTFGSSHGSALGDTTGGSLSGNNGRQLGSGASNQGGGQGGHEGSNTNPGGNPGGENHQNGTGSTAGGNNPGSGTGGDETPSGAGNTPSSPSNNPAHSDNGHGNDPGHSDPSNPGQGSGNGNGNNSTHSDNGHGNDPSQTDPSNPGQGGGNHGTGNNGK